MNAHKSLAWLKAHKKLSTLLLLVFLYGGYSLYDWSKPTPVLKLHIGEPWEEMRKKSSVQIKGTGEMISAFRMPEEPSAMEFDDPQYGFETPKTKFLVVFYNKNQVQSIRMSPQMSALPMDEIMKLIENLQGQWRKGGWTVDNPKDFPAVEDNAAFRKQIKNPWRGAHTYWNAGDKYQIVMHVQAFEDHNIWGEDRYLITLGISER